MPGLQCFDDCSFVISLKSGNVSPPSLFFFLQWSPELPYAFLDQLFTVHRTRSYSFLGSLVWVSATADTPTAWLLSDWTVAQQGWPLPRLKVRCPSEGNVSPQETQKREAVGMWGPWCVLRRVLVKRTLSLIKILWPKAEGLAERRFNGFQQETIKTRTGLWY